VGQQAEGVLALDGREDLEAAADPGQVAATAWPASWVATISFSSGVWATGCLSPISSDSLAWLTSVQRMPSQPARRAQISDSSSRCSIITGV
jgi:hypothetical protein